MSTEKQRSSAAINLSQMLAFEARLSRLHRLFKGHFNVTEPSLILEPYLFLGNCISAHDVNRLSKLGIRYILNVAIRDVEVCPYYASDVHTLTIDLRDDDRENIIRTFDQAFAFIDEAKRCRSRVLVHCSHGQSRSPAIVIGYLMRTYNVSLEQCLTHVVKARPCVLPNDGFLKQLIIYDRLLVERRVQQQKQQQQQLQQHQQQQQQQQQQQRQLQIEASITASTALPPASTALPPAEIPIHHFLPGPSQPLQPPAPVIIAPPPYPDNPTSTATTVSSVDSSSLGLSSTSSLQSSASDNSVHVIPIQIPSEEPLPAKIDPIPIHKIPVEDIPAVVKKSKKNTVQLIAKSKTSKYLTEQSKSYHESSPSIHIKKHGYSIMTTDMKQPPYYSSRSQSATRDRARAQQQYHPPISSSQQWNALSYFPTHYYASDGHQRTRYITEIYDKATNRFIPTCCF